LFGLPKTLAHGRYRVEDVFADGGGMGILFSARDTFCADNEVLIKTTRYDTGARVRNFKYTRDEAVSHIENDRKILEWEKKVLVRFRNEGLNNLPGANDFFYDRSMTLVQRYEGKGGPYTLPDEVLDREPYLVMEKISGSILEDRMAQADFRDRLEERLLTLSREILTIFIRMHRPFDVAGQPAHFLYQDLKPANILVSGEEDYTLIDFGAATLKLGEKTTEPTAGCITLGYAAPEAEGREAYVDASFDIYTLGATLWHAVTLQDPRELGADFPALSVDAMRGKGISGEMARIIAKALSQKESRYPSAAAMRKDVMDRLREIRA
jgi:serine/threonine protein kinase